MKLTRPLCLASASPRRRELLEQFGLTFDVVAPAVDETPHEGEPPEELVARLSRAKAEAARKDFPRHVILAGDTVVALGVQILGKPGSPQEAARMLGQLSGRTHRVLTGYTLLDGAGGRRIGRVVTTDVTFRVLPPEWVGWYSHLPEAWDKAGAYGIQGQGGAMVSDIRGSYTNVVGLPVESVIWDLVEQGWLTW
jgi:septum formation protein